MDDSTIAALFPATHAAMEEVGRALIGAAEAPTQVERAEILSSSTVLTKAFELSTNASTALNHGPVDDLEEEQRAVNDIWDKKERTRLKEESMERVLSLIHI